ncbi:MAG: hypothetical protein IT440_02630 [Phycisphaeraceae bacterium]|nr:hypothetical protein [Phycisphaeraceae bacterium]
MRPRVVITETLDKRCEQWLAERAEVVWCNHADPGLPAQLAQADGLVVRTYTLVNDALLDLAPKLKVVGRGGVGLDNIDLPACKRRNVMVVSTPDANTQAVVEYVFALILDELRPRSPLAGFVAPPQFHKLRETQVGLQLDQLTLGILGFGRIGKRVGQVAHAIGMKLLVNDLLPEAGLRAAVDYPFDFVDLPTLCRQSDIVTIHVDGRRENRGMMHADVLADLKDNALLINAARGMLVRNADLAAWATSHPQAKVVLDVHDPEPMPEDYAFYSLPNVRLLPHLASRTHEAMANMSWVVRDVLAVLEGGKPKYPAWG